MKLNDDKNASIKILKCNKRINLEIIENIQMDSEISRAHLQVMINKL